jgi:uncharacterized protein YndB with AHSA1/START domain
MLEVTVSRKIKAPKEKIWQTITTPDYIRNFLFGTTVSTTWKEGSAITFEGNWQGKTYSDKGKIVTFEPEKTLKHTFWSSLSGKEDKPENYVMVTYEINDNGDSCELIITQDGVKTEDEQKHLQDNWGKVADGIKRLAEEV